MKFNNFDEDNLTTVFLYIGFVLCFIGLISTPFIGFVRTQTTQKALNEQCGTNYSFLQVALAGDNLSRLCQIKNQTVTIK